MNVINIKTSTHDLSFNSIHYELDNKTPLLELLRYMEVQKIKTIFSEKLNSYNINIDVNSLIPKWLMANIINSSYTIDPIIPYNANKHDQLIKDIQNLNRDKISKEKVKKILLEINLPKICNKHIENLRTVIKSDFYLKNVNTVKVRLESNNNFYTMTILTSFLEDIVIPKSYALLESLNISLRISYSLYNRLYNKFNILNTLITKESPYFVNKVFILLLRYYTLESYNQQLAVSSIFYSKIKELYNINCELFASSLNSTYDIYGSLYYDLENEFNSIGPFHNIELRRGIYVANPPFDESIMEYMSRKMIFFLEKTKDYLGYFIIIPAWDKDEEKYGIYKSLDILKKSKYIRFIKKINKRYAKFIDYIRNKVIMPVDTYIIFVGNDKVMNMYDLSTAKLNDLVNKYWIQASINLTRKLKPRTKIKLKKINVNHNVIITDISQQYKKLKIEEKIQIKKEPIINDTKLVNNYYKILSYFNNKMIMDTNFNTKYNFTANLLLWSRYLYLNVNKISSNKITIYDKYNPTCINNNNIKYYNLNKFKIPYTREGIPLVRNKCNNNIILPYFQLENLLSNFNIKFIQNIERACIIDFTPLNKTPMKVIRTRATSYATVLVDIISKYKDDFLSHININLILDNTKNELLKKSSLNFVNNKYDFIYVSGSHNYYDMKRTTSINEQLIIVLLYYNLIFLLNSQKIGGGFIMYMLDTHLTITHQVIYMLSLNYKTIKLINLDNNSNIKYLVGINYHGKNQNIMDTLIKTINKYKKTNKLYYGQNLNVFDSKLRQKLYIEKKISRKDSNLFIHSLLKLNIPSLFIKKIQNHNKKIMINLIKKRLLIKKYMSLDIKRDSKTILKIIKYQIQRGIKYCKINNIDINPLYLK